MSRAFFRPGARGSSARVVKASKEYLYNPPPNVNVVVVFADQTRETVGPFHTDEEADAYIEQALGGNDANMGKIVTGVMFVTANHPPPNHMALVRFSDGSNTTVGPGHSKEDVKNQLKRRNFVIWGMPS